MTLNLIIAGCTVVGAVVGVNQIRIGIRDRQEKSEERIKEWISDSDKTILNNFKEHIKVIDGKFNNVDGRFKNDEDDIHDVETDMKSMVQQFRDMCDKLSKHDYLLDEIKPEFRELKREFYKFKNAVDTNTKVGFTGVHHTNDNIHDPEKER